MSSNLPQRVTLPDGTEVWVRATPLDERVAAGTRVPAPAGAGRGAGPDGGPGGGGDAGGGIADGDDDADLEPVADWGRLASRVAGLTPLVGGVAASVRAAAAAAAPDEVSVTFGVEISAGTGKAIALLADANTTAQLSVTLTWQPGSRPAGPSGAEPPAASTASSDTAASGASGTSSTASAPV
ncbi:hypothetical protein DMB38_24905 [Streptomyces sp. WAC 06738]|uniref:CU044_2847 family protein n=1 Tax=Streptomyces sp. WAC 06738 TaxID=2203210 RepID=UPI000F6B577D|nr:CU044_2847 family protein [Streptomyces sp. WAC 06738]AZM48595.1 hypothetical protein DMB38_24905 [Streptomyces sp. WAC 06738]